MVPFSCAFNLAMGSESVVAFQCSRALVSRFRNEGGIISPMPRDFFDPTPEQQSVVLINAATLREAVRMVESCEHCNPEGAEIPFDNILDLLRVQIQARQITFWNSRPNALTAVERFWKRLSLNVEPA
jgi:hypothetical protein